MDKSRMGGEKTNAKLSVKSGGEYANRSSSAEIFQNKSWAVVPYSVRDRGCRGSCFTSSWPWSRADAIGRTWMRRSNIRRTMRIWPQATFERTPIRSELDLGWALAFGNRFEHHSHLVHKPMRQHCLDPVERPGRHLQEG